MLVKGYTQAFMTLQLSDQTHMVNGYLVPAKAFFAEKGPSAPPPPPPAPRPAPRDPTPL